MLVSKQSDAKSGQGVTNGLRSPGAVCPGAASCPVLLFLFVFVFCFCVAKWYKRGARPARWSDLAARLYHPVCHPARAAGAGLGVKLGGPTRASIGPQ